MELKLFLYAYKVINFLLLIVPYGIETGLGWIQAGC